ncbi:uncharacterized protein LOC104925745 [Larimichthys crocea]|uniref:uncharacterized protein LOC104925745 n=1 Tax=Larimichthys crocea TaxID=215358 RepID=UPI000F5F3A33|nr:uncharacterized protein LOC104925745 [Larimichthys crocea]
MSLQVCHCGWSKVTTYHGLRTHQGKMGCTPRGVKVEESQQLYTWGKLGFTRDLMQDASIKTDTTDYYSGLSVQVCHCGWSKMTTYHGLRTHQGMMGCTPKGTRIREREQYNWKNQYEEVDQRKYQPPKRAIVKKEHVPSPPSWPLLPSTKVRTNSAAAAIKEEYKPHIATSQHSLQTATKSHRQLQDFSIDVQARRHPTPTYPETVVRPKDQKLPQMADSRVMAENWISRTNSATIKEEPESPSAIPQRPSQRTSNQKSGRQPQELSTGVQVNSSIREYPVIPPQVTAAQPKKKDHKNQTVSQTRERAESELQKKIQLREEKMSEIREWTERTCESVPDSTSTNTQANSAAAQTEKKEDPKSLHEAAWSDFSTGIKVKRVNMECPTTYPATVVRPKEKHREEHTLLQNVPVLPSINSEEVVKIKEEPKSPFATPQDSLQRATNSKASHQLQEFGPGVQVNRSSDTGSTTPPLARGGQPKEKDSKDQISQNLPDSTSSTTQMNPASTEATTEKDPHSLCKSAQSSDCSTGLKVKELAQIISAITTQERAARLKGKEREAELIASATTGQETADHPKEKDEEDQNLSQNLPDSSNATSQMDPASAEARTEENPKSSCETAQVSDCSTGLKVKELAQIISAITTQEKAARLKGKEREAELIASATTGQETADHPKQKDEEDQNLSQNLPDSSNATSQMDPASAEARTEENPKSSCETAQVSDCSTGLKVKELAQIISAITTQEKAARLKGKEREAELIASATTGQETADHPKQKDEEDQNLSQNVPDSSNATSQMDPASAEARTEENPRSSCETAQVSDCSTGLKVKELARMFSTTTAQETTVRPKGQQRGERKLSQNLPDSTSANTQTNPASAKATTEDDPEPSCESARLPDFSTGLKNVPESTSATTPTNAASAKATTDENPKPSCETSQLPDFSTGLKVKDLARMFAAITTQEKAVRPKGKTKEERKLSQLM